MKPIARYVSLGSVLLLVSSSPIWAEPSPDLMNSIAVIRAESAKTNSVEPESKLEHAGCLVRLETRNVTAGQCTVAVPMIAYGKK